MRRYRLAVVIGIISTICLVGTYGFYSYNRSTLLMKGTVLNSIHGAQAQLNGYAMKIATIKSEIPELMILASESNAAIEYEVELTDKSLQKLMQQVLESYTGQMFFLEHGVVESTPKGIIVTLKGFRTGRAAAPQGYEGANQARDNRVGLNDGGASAQQIPAG